MNMIHYIAVNAYRDSRPDILPSGTGFTAVEINIPAKYDSNHRHFSEIKDSFEKSGWMLWQTDGPDYDTPDGIKKALKEKYGIDTIVVSPSREPNYLQLI